MRCVTRTHQPRPKLFMQLAIDRPRESPGFRPTICGVNPKISRGFLVGSLHKMISHVLPFKILFLLLRPREGSLEPKAHQTCMSAPDNSLSSTHSPTLSKRLVRWRTASQSCVIAQVTSRTKMKNVSRQIGIKMTIKLLTFQWSLRNHPGSCALKSTILARHSQKSQTLPRAEEEVRVGARN